MWFRYASSSFLAQKKGNPFIKECMDFFGTRHFVGEDGGLFMDLINPSVMPMLAVKHGFRYIDKEQIISNGIHIYPSWVFAGNSATRRVDSYSMHFLRFELEGLFFSKENKAMAGNTLSGAL